jgi:hypothetical protein
MSKIIIVALMTFGIILLDYKKRKDIKKSIFATLIFAYIISIGFSGFTLTRAIPPLFFIHIIATILSYFSLLYYIFKDRLIWQITILPIVTIAIYIALNFIEGSRYEK